MAAAMGAMKMGMPMPTPGTGRLVQRQMAVTMRVAAATLKGSSRL